jgi:hypothetical protein
MRALDQAARQHELSLSLARGSKETVMTLSANAQRIADDIMRLVDAQDQAFTT